MKYYFTINGGLILKIENRSPLIKILSFVVSVRLYRDRIILGAHITVIEISEIKILCKFFNYIISVNYLPPKNIVIRLWPGAHYCLISVRVKLGFGPPPLIRACVLR